MVTHHNSIQLVHGHTPQFHLASSWSHTTILFSQFMVRPQFHLASSQSHTTIPFSQVMVTHHNSIQAKHMSFRLYRSFPNDNVVTHIILFSISWLIVTHHNSIQLGHGHTPQFYLASSWSDRNSMQLVHGHTQFHLASSWSHTTIPCSQFMVTHHNSIQLVHGRKPQFHLASSWSQTTIPFSQFMVTHHNSIQAKLVSFRLNRSFPHGNVVTHIILFKASFMFHSMYFSKALTCFCFCQQYPGSTCGHF